MESHRIFRVDFFKKSEFISCGWVFDHMQEYVDYSFKELYKHLLHICKDSHNCHLRDIYVTENCVPLIAFHIGECTIYVENLKTRKCMVYDRWNVL